MARRGPSTADVERQVNARVSRTVNQFNKQVKEFAETLVPEQLVLLHKKAALQALEGVVLKTPVDTGRARGNWQVSLDQAPEGEVPESKWSAVIPDGAQKILDVMPYSATWIVNNVHYVVFLENGSSDQAPRGMVALTVRELMEQFA